MTESLALGPITATVSPPRLNGKKLSLFISNVMDLRAIFNANESWAAEATTENGIFAQDTFSKSSISPSSKRAFNKRFTEVFTFSSEINPFFTLSTKAL